MTCTFIRYCAGISLFTCIRLLMSTQSATLGFAKGSATCSGLFQVLEEIGQLRFFAGFSGSSTRMLVWTQMWLSATAIIMLTAQLIEKSFLIYSFP